MTAHDRCAHVVRRGIFALPVKQGKMLRADYATKSH